jgi:hypothetical protein
MGIDTMQRETKIVEEWLFDIIIVAAIILFGIVLASGAGL